MYSLYLMSLYINLSTVKLSPNIVVYHNILGTLKLRPINILTLVNMTIYTS